VLLAVQNLFSTLQKGACSAYYDIAYYVIKSSPMDPTRDTVKIEDAMKEITDMLNTTKLAPSSSDSTSYASGKKMIYDAIISLYKSIADASSVNGVISQSKARQIILDVLASICPNQPIPKESVLAQSGVQNSMPVRTMSKSSFGSSCGCWTWIILLIIVLAVVGYLYYANKGNIRFTIPQRIAAFGRQIKTIQKM
jgi:hypothetical protein